MPPPMARRGTLFLVLFVFYCIQMGALLVLYPWTGMWDRITMAVPWERLRLALLHPAARGAVAGFGVLHFVWAAHDLHLWWREHR